MTETRDPETTRQRALDTYHIVDSLPEAAYDDIVRVAAAVCDVPIALISLIDRDRQWFKAQIGLDVHETPRDEAVCDHALRQPEELLEIPDLANDARFAHYPAVVGDTGARFYAGMPLVTPGGAAIGTVCVIDREPRVLKPDQRVALEALARLTINLMEARQRERVLERARLAATHPVEADHRYAIAILEVQGHAELVRARGERLAEQALQRIDDALHAVLAEHAGTVDRVTGSAEFVAVLLGDAGPALEALRAGADEAAEATGLELRMGSAEAAHAGEPMEMVYVRADEALSHGKDLAAAAHGSGTP